MFIVKKRFWIWIILLNSILYTWFVKDERVFDDSIQDLYEYSEINKKNKKK